MADKENLSEYLLKALKKHDEFATEVVARSNDVKLFEFNMDTNKWVSSDSEGTLLFYCRSDPQAAYGLLLLARDSTHSWNQKFDGAVEIQCRSPFLLYRSFDALDGTKIEGLWFPEKCESEAMQRMISSVTCTKSVVSVAEKNSMKNRQDGRLVLELVTEDDVEVRSRAAESAARALKAANMFIGCDYCGKGNHGVEKCWKLQGKSMGGTPQKGAMDSGQKGMARMPSPQKRTFNRQVSQPNGPTLALTDSAIIETSSSSSSTNPSKSPFVYHRQAVSPAPYLNLAPLLRTPERPSALHHASSFPAALDNAGLSSSAQKIDIKEASNRLRELLRIPTVVTPLRDAPSSLETSESSMEGEWDHPEKKFVRDVTAKLKAIAQPEHGKREEDGLPLVVSGGNIRGAYLRPPDDFESAAQELLFPEHVVIPRAKSGKNTDVGDKSGTKLVESSVVENGPLGALTKEQLLQSMEWLLKNDKEFLGRLHEGYLRSLSNSQKL